MFGLLFVHDDKVIRVLKLVLQDQRVRPRVRRIRSRVMELVCQSRQGTERSQVESCGFASSFKRASHCRRPNLRRRFSTSAGHSDCGLLGGRFRDGRNGCGCLAGRSRGETSQRTGSHTVALVQIDRRGATASGAGNQRHVRVQSKADDVEHCVVDSTERVHVGGLGDWVVSGHVTGTHRRFQWG